MTTRLTMGAGISTRAHLAHECLRQPASQAPCWPVVLRGGVLYSEMMLEWCDESAKRLRALQGPGVDDDPAQAPRPHEEDDR